jgi:hypothetical protein
MEANKNRREGERTGGMFRAQAVAALGEKFSSIWHVYPETQLKIREMICSVWQLDESHIPVEQISRSLFEERVRSERQSILKRCNFRAVQEETDTKIEGGQYQVYSRIFPFSLYQSKFESLYCASWFLF